MRKTVLFYSLLFLAAGGGILSSAVSGQGFEEKYAPILGEYEFDWGGQTGVLRFYVEEGKLWADSGDGRPAVMEPDDGDAPFKFTAVDPQTGQFRFEFLKDEEGRYSICHLINEGMGIDVRGHKVKQTY